MKSDLIDVFDEYADLADSVQRRIIEIDNKPHRAKRLRPFRTREAAAKTLDGFGEAAVAAARERLRAEDSAEAQARLRRFLAKHAGPATGGAKLREVRAVELLEHLGTPAAAKLLGELAAGGPSRLTADAAGAAKRVKAR